MNIQNPCFGAWSGEEFSKSYLRKRSLGLRASEQQPKSGYYMDRTRELFLQEDIARMAELDKILAEERQQGRHK